MDLSMENKLLKIEIEKHLSTIFILETHLHELLSKETEETEETEDGNDKDYCEGVIRETIDGKSYHGSKLVGEKPWFYETFGKCHLFFEYNKDYVWKPHQTPSIFDTKDAHVFCSNCVLDEELSKRKRTHRIYRCLGH